MHANAKAATLFRMFSTQLLAVYDVVLTVLQYGFTAPRTIRLPVCDTFIHAY